MDGKENPAGGGSGVFQSQRKHSGESEVRLADDSEKKRARGGGGLQKLGAARATDASIEANGRQTFIGVTR